MNVVCVFQHVWRKSAVKCLTSHVKQNCQTYFSIYVKRKKKRNEKFLSVFTFLFTIFKWQQISKWKWKSSNKKMEKNLPNANCMNALEFVLYIQFEKACLLYDSRWKKSFGSISFHEKLWKRILFWSWKKVFPYVFARKLSANILCMKQFSSRWISQDIKFRIRQYQHFTHFYCF